ncbi:hypothetical protein ACU4GR_00580 [Methylobacterium oryzae CBMB20]
MVRRRGQGLGARHHLVEGGIGEIDDRHLLDRVPFADVLERVG